MVELGGSSQAWEQLRAIGRTEDVRFSPSNRRLAIAAFGRGAVAVLDVTVSRSERGTCLELRSIAALPLGEGRRPHGLDWLDDGTLVIADRDGSVELVEVVAGPGGAERLDACPIEGGFSGTRSPGSVRAQAGPGGVHEVLVCNNYAGTVSLHVVERTAGSWRVTASRPLLQRWLDVPDGVALSPDGRWLAVSNHIPHLVMVYDRHRHLDPTSEPDAVLRGVGYPHGLAFTADGAHLLVADAGSRFVHAFAAADHGWEGVGLPVASLAAMDEPTFQLGRERPQEGGPKGLDIDRSGTVLVVTSEHQPLSVHDLEALLRPGANPPDGPQLMATELAALADDAERRAGFEASARAAAVDADRRVAAAEQRRAEAERRATEAERLVVDAERRAEAALVIAREADTRARAAAGRPWRAWLTRRRRAR